MQKQICCFILLSFFVCIVFPPLCLSSLESDSYIITTQVFSNGCADMTSESYVNSITIGQPSPLTENIPIQSASYNLYPGFWYTTSPALSLFAKAYGSLKGESNYSSECDFDKDNDVDGLDLYRYLTQL